MISLSKMFRPKVTAIEESKNLELVKIEELVDYSKPMNYPYLIQRKISLLP